MLPNQIKDGGGLRLLTAEFCLVHWNQNVLDINTTHPPCTLRQWLCMCFESEGGLKKNICTRANHSYTVLLLQRN